MSQGRVERILLFQAMISRGSRFLALDSIHGATSSSLAPVATNALRLSAEISVKSRKLLLRSRTLLFGIFSDIGCGLG